MAFRKAQRTNAKLRLALTGPAGSGKTYSALLIAKGLGGRIAMIDTENGSGDLYSDLCDYDIQPITAPFDVRKYLQAVYEAAQAGYTTLIIDSLSHAWSGEGGLLDVQARIAKNMRSGNSYAAWREVTPWQNRLINSLLSSPCHIIATMRSKTEYVISENDKGRTEIRKVGLAPVQREGVDYEFGTVFDITAEHMASVSKDRTGLFGDMPFIVTEQTGITLRKWLDNAEIQNPQQ